MRLWIESLRMILGVAPIFTPANLDGILFGESTKFTHVRVQKMATRASAKSNGTKDEADVYVLSFQQGDEFMPERAIRFHVNVDPGKNFGKISINQPSVKFGSDEYRKTIHGHSKGTSCGRGALCAFIDKDKKMESANDQIKFKFFAKPDGKDRYRAYIFAYSAEHKSGVQGKFSFKIDRSE